MLEALTEHVSSKPERTHTPPLGKVPQAPSSLRGV